MKPSFSTTTTGLFSWQSIAMGRFFLLERIGPHGSANFLYSPLNIFAAHLRMGGIFVWPNFPLQTKKKPFWNSSPLLLRRVTSSASGKNSGKTSSTLKPQSCEFLQPMSREYVSPYQTSTYRRFNFFRGFYFFSHLLASKICHYKTGDLSFEPSF